MGLINLVESLSSLTIEALEKLPESETLVLQAKIISALPPGEAAAWEAVCENESPEIAVAAAVVATGITIVLAPEIIAGLGIATIGDAIATALAGSVTTGVMQG